MNELARILKSPFPRSDIYSKTDIAIFTVF